MLNRVMAAIYDSEEAPVLSHLSVPGKPAVSCSSETPMACIDSVEQPLFFFPLDAEEFDDHRIGKSSLSLRTLQPFPAIL